MAPSPKSLKNWQRLAGKAFVSLGNWEWPEPCKPLACHRNVAYRQKIKCIFQSGEEIFVGKLEKGERVYFFEQMDY